MTWLDDGIEVVSGRSVLDAVDEVFAEPPPDVPEVKEPKQVDEAYGLLGLIGDCVERTGRLPSELKGAPHAC